MLDRPARLLWTLVAGVSLSQAYLTHGAFALPGVLALGLALPTREHPRPLRASLAVGVIVQLLVGLHCWGFVRYGAPVYAGTVVYSGLCGALFGLLASGRHRAPTALSAAAAWGAVEALRQVGGLGFPLYLGATQVALPWRSALSVVGAAGVSALLVGLGVAVVRRRRVAIWLGVFAAAAVGGLWQPGLSPAGPPVRVAIVQGGVTPSLYDAASLSEAARTVVRHRYFSLAGDAARSADLVVLPEAALHRPTPTRGEQALSPIVPRVPEAAGTTFITGTYRISVEGTEQYNSALAFEASDPRTIRGVADKRLLAPIAEAAFTAGEALGVISTPSAEVAPLICWESMYPRLARGAAGTAGVLAVLTNDAGFHRSPVAHAHSDQGRSRAIENGRPLLRAAQAGISYASDHGGRLATSLGVFESGVLHATIVPMSGWTWHGAGGYLLELLLLAFVVVRLVVPRRAARTA